MSNNLDPDDDQVETERVARFAAHCAHDFNNLLTGILGNLELLQNRARRAGVTNLDGYLDGARRAAGRAAGFTQRLLAFSGRATGEPEKVPVDRLARDLVELMRGQAVTVTADLGAGEAAAFCDPHQLELALLELLNNAADATRERGSVTIRTRAAAEAVMIAVIDTGVGMPPDIAEQALEPFFTTCPNGAGKGLGLSLVKYFARHAGGGMRLETTAGTGTTVSLSLPSA